LGEAQERGSGNFPDNEIAGVPLTVGQGAAVDGAGVRFSVAAAPMLAGILFLYPHHYTIFRFFIIHNLNTS